MIFNSIRSIASRSARSASRAVAGASLVAAVAAPAAAQQGTYIAQNDLLVVRIESAPAIGQWDFSTATPGFVGDGYFIWNGPNFFNQPGVAGIFGYDFEVQTGGNWILSLRNRHENPDPTEENDVWIRMDNGPWIKTFSNGPESVGAWTWESRFELHSSFPQANYNLTPGAHRIEFSGRSFGFKMDRFHLHKPNTPGQNDPMQPESPRRFGTSYCVASANSSGSASDLSAIGSPIVSFNEVTLSCSSLPANVLGYFIVGDANISIPNAGGSAGRLCVGGNLGRYAGNIINSGSEGRAVLGIDLSALPLSNGNNPAVQAGQTWNFQFWHRDTSSAGPTSNFSRALAINFE